MKPSLAARWRRFRRYTWAHRSTAAVFLLLLVLARHGAFPWIEGSLTSTRLFGVLPLVDPLSAVEVLLASRTWTPALLWGAAILLVFWALIGRGFCGWLCPLGLILDLNDDVRRWLQRALRRYGVRHHRGLLRLPEWRLARETKYWLLAACLLLSLLASVPVFTTVSPINVVALAFVFSPGIELSLVAAIIALEHVAPRAFCRALCPLGAFYALVGRFGRLAMRSDPDHAGKLICRQCTLHCPMGIEVLHDHVLAGHEKVDDPECTRCGSCADVCRSDVLYLGFSRREAPPVAEMTER